MEEDDYLHQYLASESAKQSTNNVFLSTNIWLYSSIVQILVLLCTITILYEKKIYKLRIIVNCKPVVNYVLKFILWCSQENRKYLKIQFNFSTHSTL